MSKLNVTEAELRAYIEVFNKTLAQTAMQYLPIELHGQLQHLSLLPARIIGYVSTQFGVAIEYTPYANTEITTVRDSSRVEDLFVKAPPQLRNTRPVVNLVDSDTNFIGATLQGSFPFRISGQQSKLSFSKVVFRAGAWERVVEYAEVFGNRLYENWSSERAISRAKDEVLAAMVEAHQAAKNHITIDQYINEFKRKTVLVLGDYDEAGLAHLETIIHLLNKLGYNPLLMRDVPDNPYQDLPQKLVAIGAIVRFIVIDDSSKSGHLVEFQLCKENNWITVLLHAEGHPISWMTAGASATSKVLFESLYDPTSLEKKLVETTGWAEEKLTVLKRQYDNLYPWRKVG